MTSDHQFFARRTVMNISLSYVHAARPPLHFASFFEKAWERPVYRLKTGVGKGLIAKKIHSLSGRRRHAFVNVNCAAIPLGLLESELFGHERGAFTGAISQRIGRFELAHNGTLFLDEIGDIPLELQPKLLRVIQDQEFERLGSARTIRTDVRLIAATHRNLAQMVERRLFRQDLFYRVNLFPIL